MTKLSVQLFQPRIRGLSGCPRQFKSSTTVLHMPWRTGQFAHETEGMLVGVLLLLAALLGTSPTMGQAVTPDINVQLRPVVENIDLVTDINVVGNTMFVCTQPGQLYRKNLSANT